MNLVIIDYSTHVADILQEHSAIIDIEFLDISKTDGHNHRCIRECNFLHMRDNWLLFKSYTFYSRTCIPYTQLSDTNKKTFNYLQRNGFFTGDYYLQSFRHNRMINVTNNCEDFEKELFDLLRCINLDNKELKFMHKGGDVEKELLRGKFKSLDITDTCKYFDIKKTLYTHPRG